MRRSSILCFLSGVGLAGFAQADPTYSFHENLHVGQKVVIAQAYDCTSKYAWKSNGSSDPVDNKNGYHWTVALNIQQVKDGSDTQAMADVDADSYDSSQEAGKDEKKTVCPYVGKSVRLTRLADDSFTNDFKGDASTGDSNMLNNFLSPDEDFYPDTPVAIGEVWDDSAKLSKHSQLGANDLLLSSCRLDWVKTIDGKPMAADIQLNRDRLSRRQQC